MAEVQTKYVWPQQIANDSYNKEPYISRNTFHVDYLKHNFDDFARSNLFKVEFFLPSTIANKFNFISTDATNKVEMTAKNVNLPAYDMSVHEIKRMGYKLQLPATMNSGACQFTFMCDDTYKQRKFLHSWFHNIVYNFENNKYRSTIGILGCTIQVYQLDNNFNVVFGVRLSNCWPSSIGEIQLSHDSENQITEFPVTFAYSNYQILTTETDTKNA